MRENQVPVHYTSAEETGRVRPVVDSGDGGSKYATWLLSSAVIAVTTLYTICNPKWVPSCVAQSGKISQQLSADIEKKASPPQSKPITNNAIDLTNQGSNQASPSPATEMPKGAEAKTSKLNKAFMVPPPPPTPCVLPPAFGSQQAQAHASPETDNGENTPQQSTAASGTSEGTQSPEQAVAEQKLEAADKELQAADQELQAALRSSLSTVGEWTR